MVDSIGFDVIYWQRGRFDQRPEGEQAVFVQGEQLREEIIRLSDW